MKKPVRVLLCCPNPRVSRSELSGLGYSCALFGELDGFLALSHITRFSRLYAARTFYEAGVYFASFPSLPAAIGAVKSGVFLAFIKNIYGTLELSYRTGAPGASFSDMGRKGIAQKVADALSSTPLKNSPSAYDFETDFCRESAVSSSLFTQALAWTAGSTTGKTPSALLSIRR